MQSKPAAHKCYTESRNLYNKLFFQDMKNHYFERYDKAIKRTKFTWET